jgi:hypothetical protein
MKDIEGTAFTNTYIGLANKLQTKITLRPPFSSEIREINALWDTGATSSCISTELAESMGLIATGYKNVYSATGMQECPTYLVNVTLPNKVEVNDIVAFGTSIRSQGIDMLVGMDIILLGDFVITNADGNTIFTYCYPSQKRIDFVKQIGFQKARGPVHGPGKKNYKKSK